MYRRGWFGDSYRHYLAGKGIRTRQDFFKGGRADRLDYRMFDQRQLAAGARVEREHTSDRAKALEIAGDHLAEDPEYYKKLKIMERTPYKVMVQRLPPGYVYPVSPEMVQKRLEQLPEGQLDGLKAVEFAPPRTEDEKDAWARYVRSKKTVRIYGQPFDGELVDGKDPAEVQEHMEDYVLPHEVGHHIALSQRNITDADLAVAEARADANVAGMDVEDVAPRPKKEDDVVEYVRENVRSRYEGDRLQNFWSGVKELAAHPWKEADKDWKSYRRAAKQPATLSRDPVNRWNERGAALFGRVVTMANVEPLVDREEGKSMRESVVDITFGRRS